MLGMQRHHTSRTPLRLAAALVTVGALALAAGCGDDDTKSDAPAETVAASVSITGQWARTSPSAATIGAAYATFTSATGDAIIGVSVDPSIAKTAEMHEMVMADTGTTMAMGGSDTTMAMGGTETTMGEMTMQPVARVALPAGTAVEFKPGSYHFMLMDLVKPLEVGTTIAITFEFEKAGSITVDVPVLDEAP